MYLKHIQEVNQFVDRYYNLQELLVNENVIRPANFGEGVWGRGFGIIDKGAYKVGVINLLGRVWLEGHLDPFSKAEEIIEELKKETSIILIDFHAEATAEKKAFGYYFDGKVSAIFGTHTHVQTADNQILPMGSGYITDLGMTGPKDGILGVEKECVLYRFTTKMPKRYTVAQGDIEAQGAIFDIDPFAKKTLSVKRVKF